LGSEISGLKINTRVKTSNPAPRKALFKTDTEALYRNNFRHQEPQKPNPSQLGTSQVASSLFSSLRKNHLRRNTEVHDGKITGDPRVLQSHLEKVAIVLQQNKPERDTLSALSTKPPRREIVT
jgi:hypothetical protein